MLNSLWNMISGSAPPAAAPAPANAASGGGLLSFAGQVAYRNQPARKNGADYDHLFKIVVVGTQFFDSSVLHFAEKFTSR